MRHRTKSSARSKPRKPETARADARQAGDDTRRRIVDAADELFYERSFEATSFADIAAEVGLSRGNFYYHFKTKDEILDAVIALRLARTRATLDAWDEASALPAQRIRSFVQILVMN